MTPLHSMTLDPDVHVGFWCKGRKLCPGVLQSIFSKFLLGNPHLCLSGYSSDHWFSVSIPDKEGETTRIEGLKICCCNHLHFEHHNCGLGIGDILSKNVHQHWDWNKCIWNLLLNNHLPCSDIHSQG